MKAWLIVCSLIFVLLFPIQVSAAENEDNPWRELTDITSKSLNMTKAKEYSDAKQLLQYFEQKFMDRRQSESLELTLNDFKLIAITHSAAMEALTSASESHPNRVAAITKFHLLIDAMSTTYQPLWKNTEKRVLKPFEAMKNAVINNDSEKFHVYLNQFLSQYELIHPSLLVDLSVDHITRLDSYITYLDSNRDEIVNNPDQLEQLNQIESDLTALFKDSHKDNADPSLFWLIFMIGGFILSTFIYVGWKKYKHERAPIKVHRNYI